MPIYEYACKSCGFEKDALQKMSDAPLTLCPECNQATFVKKISAAGFRLSGSGWYQTDSKASKKTETKNDTSSSNKKNDDKTVSGDTPPTKNSGSDSSGSDKSTSNESKSTNATKAV